MYVENLKVSDNMMCPLLLLLITAALASLVDCFCPQQTHTDTVKFTMELGTVDYVRVSHPILVPCCAEGYENISWYRKENDTWLSFPPSVYVDDNTPALEEDGQILRIYAAELTDQTSYRCDVTGKRKIIQHITDIKVKQCDPLARGPIPTSPFPENQTIYEYGGNITIYCTGYFGCSDPDQFVFWMVNGKPARQVSPRYLVQTSQNSEQAMKQATLTITSVQEEDVQRTFLCLLATPREMYGQTRIKVRIFKKECDLLTRGPIPTSPFPENQTIYEYGGNVTIYCTGYFGCSDPDPGSDQLVLWEVNGKRAQEVSPRYLEQTSHNSEKTIMQATLTITSVQEEDVQRTFLCIISTPREKEGQMSIKVRVFKECDPLARGPIPASPFPENQTIYEYGGNITLYCTGHFGCSDPDQGSDQLVSWVVNDKPAQKVSPRYLQQTSHNSEQTMKQATLTITSVQEEDVQRTFLCVLATSQEKEGQTSIKVRIFKKDKPKTPWLEIGLIIGGGVAFIIFVISLVAVLRHFYGPKIQLYFSSRILMLGPKTIDNEKYCYNLFIYHADKDETKAQHIKDVLENKCYKVYISADMKENQNVMDTLFEKTAKSAMVSFLYSNDLWNDDLAIFFLRSFIVERKGRDLLILEVTDYKPEEIMDWAFHAIDIHELQEKYLDQREFGNGRIIEDSANENARFIEEIDGSDEAVTEKKLVDELKFWKYLPRIKVPADDKNNRKMEYFWCSLRNKIPKFAEQKQKF